MPEEMTPEQMKQWMRQWRNAEVELQRQKMRELQAMTDEEALRRFDAAMAAAEGVPIHRAGTTLVAWNSSAGS